MKPLEVCIYANDKGSDCKFTLKTKCKTVADLRFVQKAVNEFFLKEIHAVEGEEALADAR